MHGTFFARQPGNTTTAQTRNRRIRTSILALILALGLIYPLGPVAPVRAQAQEIGYLWSIAFDFDNSYHGLLTIEVGPWENGNLVEVHESSTTPVRCWPVGTVTLQGGDAVFDGTGYLECSLDLAATVEANHGLVIDEIDEYGSILLRARILAEASGVAPLFTHADAVYSVDYTQTQSAVMQHQLTNDIGLMHATFVGQTIFNWHTLTFIYSCISNGGPCDANHRLNTQSQTDPTAGNPVHFGTGPTTFQIGHDSGVFFTGRIGSLIIDPGNSAH